MYHVTHSIEVIDIPSRNPFASVRTSREVDVNVVDFWFPLQTLADEVEMHTATIGAHRATENAKHLLDLVAMTTDESRQFMSFAKTAMSKVFAAICQNVDGVECAYAFDESSSSSTDFDSSHSAHFTARFVGEFNSNFLAPADSFMSDSLVNLIAYKWMERAYPDEIGTFASAYQDSILELERNIHWLQGNQINNVSPRMA